MGYFYFELKFVSTFYLFVSGIWARIQGEQETPFISVYIASQLLFHKSRWKMCVPFSHLQTASGEFDYTSLSFLHKTPRAAWKHGIKMDPYNTQGMLSNIPLKYLLWQHVLYTVLIRLRGRVKIFSIYSREHEVNN